MFFCYCRFEFSAGITRALEEIRSPPHAPEQGAQERRAGHGQVGPHRRIDSDRTARGAGNVFTSVGERLVSPRRQRLSYTRRSSGPESVSRASTLSPISASKSAGEDDDDGVEGDHLSQDGGGDAFSANSIPILVLSPAPSLPLSSSPLSKQTTSLAQQERQSAHHTAGENARSLQSPSHEGHLPAHELHASVFTSAAATAAAAAALVVLGGGAVSKANDEGPEIIDKIDTTDRPRADGNQNITARGSCYDCNPDITVTSTTSTTAPSAAASASTTPAHTSLAPPVVDASAIMPASVYSTPQESEDTARPSLQHLQQLQAEEVTVTAHPRAPSPSSPSTSRRESRRSSLPVFARSPRASRQSPIPRTSSPRPSIDQERDCSSPSRIPMRNRRSRSSLTNSDQLSDRLGDVCSSLAGSQRPSSHRLLRSSGTDV